MRPSGESSPLVSLRSLQRARRGRRLEVRARSIRLHGVCAVLILLSGALVSAFAQEPSREREAVRRAQQQNAKLQQENARLQQEKVDVEQKLKAAEAQAAKLKGQVGRLQRSAAGLKTVEKEKADLQAKLDTTDERLKQTAQTAREQIAGLQRSVAESRAALEQLQDESQKTATTLQVSVQRETQRAAACETKNRQLYSVTLDLVDHYKQNRGAWEKFLLSEPFTGLKSVEVENLLEDFRIKAALGRVQSAAPAGNAR